MASDIAVPPASSDWEPEQPGGAAAAPPSPLVGYGLALVLIGAATIVAFVVQHIVPASNLSLVYVVPVIIAALSFGWEPSLLSALLAVGLVDFLFIEPRLSLQVASPSDLWSLGLLLVVAAIASTVGSQSRGRALAARNAARQAEALQTLAHAVITCEPHVVLVRMAAAALGDIFNAPAVILTQTSGTLVPAASTGGTRLSDADREAARWSLANGKPTRGESYPFDQSEFDFWPVSTTRHGQLVLGVKLTGRAEGRPDVPDRHIELVAAYLTAGV